MRIRDYGDWVTISAVLSSGEWKKEYGHETLEGLLVKTKDILSNKDLYYAVIEFKRHSRVIKTLKISPAAVKHTITTTVYENGQPVENYIRTCLKGQLVNKLIELNKGE